MTNYQIYTIDGWTDQHGVTHRASAETMALTKTDCGQAIPAGERLDAGGVPVTCKECGW